MLLNTVKHSNRIQKKQTQQYCRPLTCSLCWEVFFPDIKKKKKEVTLNIHWWSRNVFHDCILLTID